MTLILSGTDGLSDVDGSAATPAIRGTDANTGIFFPAADTIAFSEGGTEAMRIDSSGNLGVGTSSPNTKLDVNSGTLGYALTLQAATDTSRKYQLGIQSNGLSFYDTTAAAVRMVIDTSGNLLVGRTTTIDSYGVAFSKANDRNLILNSSTSGSGVYTTLAFSNQDTPKAFLFWLSTDSRFYVQNGTGGVYVSQNGTSWTSSSDERFKTSLVPIEDAVNKVSSLRAVTGRFLEDEENISRAFLIAQDVQSVFPQAVDADDPEKLGVRYTDTIPLLVAAIKEQQAIITQLQADVAALKGTP